MSVDSATVRRIAHLARIAVAEDEVEHLKDELNAMLAFVEQLQEVNVDGVEPMTSVTPMAMKKREDVVDDGDIADDIVKNAPATEGHYFLVPKVVEYSRLFIPPSSGARSETRGSRAVRRGWPGVWAVRRRFAPLPGHDEVRECAGPARKASGSGSGR